MKCVFTNKSWVSISVLTLTITCALTKTIIGLVFSPSTQKLVFVIFLFWSRKKTSGQERGLVLRFHKMSIHYKNNVLCMRSTCHLLLDNSFSKFHQGSNSCWSCVELWNIVLVNHIPETSRVRIKWSTLKLQSRALQCINQSLWLWTVIQTCCCGADLTWQSTVHANSPT